VAPGSGNPQVVRYLDALMHHLIVLQKDRPASPQIIAVTSARPGEGVSTVAANLAVRLARLGQGQVLLVDMNLVNLDQQDSGQQEQYPALGNMLALQGREDAGQLPAPLIDKLFLMHYSGQSLSPVEIGELQNMWREDYDFVVMDVPPVLSNGSALFLSGVADKVILVVEAERERWQVIRRAQELLEEAHANVFGAILNKRTMYIPEWLYQRL
jgi:succinoglycan biosynthesis transport protein ExoP